MTALLVWITSSAFAIDSYNFPVTGACRPIPCLSVLSQDGAIVPPDYFERAAREIAPRELEWFEITLTTHAGEVEVTADGVWLDPREGLVDEEAGTVKWVVAIRDAARGMLLEVRNPSERDGAEFELEGSVVGTL